MMRRAVLFWAVAMLASRDSLAAANEANANPANDVAIPNTALAAELEATRRGPASAKATARQARAKSKARKRKPKRRT